MMVKVMYNDQLVYKVVIWVFFRISLWKEKVALIKGYHEFMTRLTEKSSSSHDFIWLLNRTEWHFVEQECSGVRLDGQWWLNQYSSMLEETLNFNTTQSTSGNCKFYFSDFSDYHILIPSMGELVYRSPKSTF